MIWLISLAAFALAYLCGLVTGYWARGERSRCWHEPTKFEQTQFAAALDRVDRQALELPAVRRRQRIEVVS